MIKSAIPFGFRKRDKFSEKDWLSVDDPSYSNFDYVDIHFNSCETVRRIFSLARQLGFHSFLIEEADDEHPRLMEDNKLFTKYDSGFEKSIVSRISFFKSKTNRLPTQNDFLGYVVIKQEFFKNDANPYTYVYEAVLKSHRQDIRNDFLHCKRTYQVEYSFGKFGITGVLYAQQNTKTFVCAHVALRTVLSLLLDDGDISYSDINKLAKLNTYPINNDMTSEAINTVLRKLSLSFVEFDKSELGQIHFTDKLYGHIESGCPCLLGFDVTNKQQRISHIIPILGHTFDDDACVSYAKKEYFEDCNYNYSSSDWLNSFLIHDDNFGNYHTIKKDFISNENFLHLWGITNNSRKHALYCTEVLQVANDYLSQFVEEKRYGVQEQFLWFNRMISFALEKKIILRPLFVDRHSYISYLQSYRFDEVIEQKCKQLPDEFWIVEISCPELFSATRAKFGEVLIDGKIHNDDPETFLPEVLGCRVPSQFYFGTSPVLTTPNIYTDIHIND
jgi:hypothetical protein